MRGAIMLLEEGRPVGMLSSMRPGKLQKTWAEWNPEGAESQGLRLRSAREADFPGILAMMLDPSTLAGLGETAEHAEQLLRRLWYEEPETSGLRHFVAETAAAGEMIAYLRLEYPFGEPGCLWLNCFFVAPRRRRQGFGRRIIGLLTAAARDSGCVITFGMHTFAANAPAVRLYESTGFECIKREPWRSYDGVVSDRLTFRAVLPGGGKRCR